MPVILDERVITLEFRDMAERIPVRLPDKPRERAPGHHLSGILGYIAERHWGLTHDQVVADLDTEYSWRMALGVMFEEFWFSLPAQSQSMWQPGQAAQDGISINPDGLWFGCPVPGIEACHLLEETKCTEKKVRSGDEFLGERMWMHQGRGYAYVYEVEVVKWTILYYRGDWRGSGPICKQYTVKFSPLELRQTWDMVLRFKEEAPVEVGV